MEHTLRNGPGNQFALTVGLTILAITYLTAPTHAVKSMPRKLLSIVGSVAIIPLVIASGLTYRSKAWPQGDLTSRFLAVLLFLMLPLALAWWLRGFASWKNLAAAFWVILLGTFSISTLSILCEAWCALGAIGFVAWGVTETRPTFINVGTIGFALSVVFFYFTDVMDKLDRSLSLILLGVLFLAGGWTLEKLRRRLLAGLAE